MVAQFELWLILRINIVFHFAPPKVKPQFEAKHKQYDGDEEEYYTRRHQDRD